MGGVVLVGWFWWGMGFLRSLNWYGLGGIVLRSRVSDGESLCFFIFILLDYYTNAKVRHLFSRILGPAWQKWDCSVGRPFPLVKIAFPPF